MRCTLVASIALLGISCAPVRIAAQENPRPQSSPTLFEPDNYSHGFEGAAPPSDAVLNALLKTKEAQLERQKLKGLDRMDLRRRFSVVKIDLGVQNESDYVALGSDPMSGADCFWFWIVRSVNGEARVILFANAYTLELLKESTNGLRDIRTVWSSAAGYTLTDIYRFDGVKYRRIHAFTKTDRLP